MGLRVMTRPLLTRPHTQTGKSGGQMHGCSLSRKRFLTMRSSREWNVMMLSLPLGFSRSIMVSMDCSSTVSS